MSVAVLNCAERPDLAERLDELRDSFPEFMYHGDAANRYWGDLYERFPAFQLVLHDPDTDSLLGKGNTIPIVWDGTIGGLPGGIDDVLEQGVLLHERGGTPSTLCALVAIVDPSARGGRLSGLIIEGMQSAAYNHGLDALIAPVRPTWKSRYPLTPFERYVSWRREDGLSFDPWIRLHERLGAETLGVCPESFVVTETVAEWETWTGMAFPESGQYALEGALVPVSIDRERDTGRYVEPNLWMRHEVAPSGKR